MDSAVMEGNPHSIIEGMMIAAMAIGADEGYVYVRTEYPLAVKRIRAAVKAALEAGILGDNMLGTDRAFNLTVMEGAGAFVCGEETALIASVEGKRGMPTPKPPSPRKRACLASPPRSTMSKPFRPCLSFLKWAWTNTKSSAPLRRPAPKPLPSPAMF